VSFDPVVAKAAHAPARARAMRRTDCANGTFFFVAKKSDKLIFVSAPATKLMIACAFGFAPVDRPGAEGYVCRP
jgi:hypothetical protein